jgi:hypothetical protein
MICGPLFRLAEGKLRQIVPIYNYQFVFIDLVPNYYSYQCDNFSRAPAMIPAITFLRWKVCGRRV